MILCVTQKRKVKAIQIKDQNFQKIAEFKCRERCPPQNRKINVSREFLRGLKNRDDFKNIKQPAIIHQNTKRLRGVGGE